MSAYQLSALTEPVERGGVAAGGVSAAANVILGTTYLLLACDTEDECRLTRSLSAINVSLGALNVVTTLLLDTVAPKTAIQPVVAFDGENAQVGLLIRAW